MLKKMKSAELVGKPDGDGLNPGAIDTKKWRTWYKSLMNYLSSLTGVTGVPLLYVIRKQDLDFDPDNEDDEAIKLELQAPLQGDSFDVDNSRVYRILKHCTLG